MKVVPSLAENGWIRDKKLQMHYLFSYFKTSRYSQSVLYFRNISSLDYLLQEYGDDPTRLQTAVTNTLEKLYLRFYTTVDVFTEVKITKHDSKHITILYINIDTKDENGKSYKLSETIRKTTDTIDYETNKYYQ